MLYTYCDEVDKNSIQQLLANEHMDNEHYIVLKTSDTPYFLNKPGEIAFVFIKGEQPSIGDFTMFNHNNETRILYVAGKDFLGNFIYLYKDQLDKVKARSFCSSLSIHCSNRAVAWIDIDQGKLHYL